MVTDKNDPKYRTLTPPRDPAAVGWWRDGPRPGAPKGSALILGHTQKVPGAVGVGDGALGHISRLRPRDRIDVTTDGGTIHYSVTKVAPDWSYQKVAKDAQSIDDRDFPDGRLVLITCWYDGIRFSGNTFVFAEPL
ncbi:hypothetical protein GCM10023317_24060 [Actinopolymorpha pittospori]